nr:MAG TPA: hypothetical protein [Caudoviricetes sp.]
MPPQYVVCIESSTTKGYMQCIYLFIKSRIY